MVKDALEFHIDSNDYFGTVATVIDLLRQDLKRDGYLEFHSEILKKLVDEFLLLQEKYRIEKVNNQ